MLLLGVVFAELRFRQAAAPCSPGIGGWVGPMRVLLSLLLSKLRLGRERLGWESAGWSPQPLAGLTKSPGRLEQSPGRVLESSLWLAAIAAPLRSSATGLVLFAWALGPDPASSGGVGTKIESDSG